MLTGCYIYYIKVVYVEFKLSVVIVLESMAINKQKAFLPVFLSIFFVESPSSH